MDAVQNGLEQNDKAFSHKKAQAAQTNFFVHSLRLLSFFVARSFCLIRVSLR